MSEFERVLSDEEVDSIVKNTTMLLGQSIARSKDFILRVEQAVLEKLSEQEPVAWASSKIVGHYIPHDTKVTAADWFKGGLDVPLYTHPMPCVSNESDKAACDSQNEKYETQIPDGTFINEGTIHLEYIKRYQKWRRGEDKTMSEMGLAPKQIGEALDWLIGVAENHIASTGDGNAFSARDLCLETGYTKWDSFKNLVLRASQMIENGMAKGSIKETKKSVDIGSGAKRRILDYKLDAQAKELVCFLAGSFKLNGYYALRNETAILSLVKKWCDLRGIATHPQKEVDGFFVDLQVGESISIEFDEPHHAEQKKEDEIKTKALQAHGNRVLRFGIDCDVIDIITELEKLTLANEMVTPLAQRKIQALLDKGEYRVIENATVLVSENGHAAIVNRGGAFYWVDNRELAREFDAAPKYTGEK